MAWKLENRRISNLHCEISRLPCAAGYGRNGATGHD